MYLYGINETILLRVLTAFNSGSHSSILFISSREDAIYTYYASFRKNSRKISEKKLLLMCLRVIKIS